MVTLMVTRRETLPASSFTDFGTLLRVLRRRAQLTQRDLGDAVGYSEAQISRLEQRKRLPDPAVVAALFLPALRLGTEPALAARLHELAVIARGGQSGAHPGDLAAIPAAPSHYIERRAALAELRDRLAADQRVLMRGLPGMGKTSLAAALARERAADGPVCWITLTAGITTPAEAVTRLLARFLARHGHAEVQPLCGPGQVETPLPRDEQLHLITTALARADALICLDNAHLVRAEPDTVTLIEHLAGTSSARMLAISREDVPLAGFAPLRVGGLAADESAALARALAGPLLSEPLAVALAERAGGSPMLIRLALGQLQPGGPRAAALIDRLEADPGIAGYLLQSTLAGLSEPSRRLISMLAVFRHPVDLLDERLIEASETLGGGYDVLAGLDELRRRQLVDHPARADLHPLVRDYLYAGLVGAAAGRRALHQMAAQYCERALHDPLEACWHLARAGDAAEAADLLAARAADLAATGRSGRAADLAAELLAAGDVTGDTARQLLTARGDLLLHTERAGEAEDAYRQALALPGPRPVRAELSGRLAQSLLQRGKVPDALALCREVIGGLAPGEDVLLARLTVLAARAHVMLSEYAEATDLATRACAAADVIAAITPGDAAAVRARAYWALGVAARLRGEPDAAAGWLEQAITAARAAGLPEVAGRSLFSLGAIGAESGQLAEAERQYSAALAELRPIGDGYGIARVLHGLALLRHIAGDLDAAISLYDEAVALKRRMGDPLGAANSEHSRALVLLSRGQTGAARAALTAILAGTTALGERYARGHYLDSLAMVDLVEGDWRSAGDHLAAAAGIAAEVGIPSLLAETTVHRAFAVLSAGDLAGATSLWQATAEQAGAAGTGMHANGALQHLALTACLALARQDYPGAAAAAAAMSSQAAAGGDVRYGRGARQLAAAIAAAAAPGGTAPPLADLPRVLWVWGAAGPAVPG
jgi:ATP/maltotriose-dependent transcriptional regulator MalT/DNA-binding XRE family transcriptional regulator